MEIQGKIIQVLPMQEGVGRNGNPWKLQPYVLETFEQYPRKVYFEVFGEDNVGRIKAELDEPVNVGIDIESREYNGRWYTQVRAWSIKHLAERPAAPAEQKNTNVVKPEEEKDTLPF